MTDPTAYFDDQPDDDPPPPGGKDPETSPPATDSVKVPVPGAVPVDPGPEDEEEPNP